MSTFKHAACALLSLIIIGSSGNALASHQIGGEFTYQFLDSSLSGHYHYRITLTTYADCINGQPEAIAQDNPAYFGIFNGSGSTLIIDTAVMYTSSVALPVSYTSICGTAAFPSGSVCILKRVFSKDYQLPYSSTGYILAYQRCCRSAAIVNLVNPADGGSTYFGTIPSPAIINNSAKFTNDPPLVVCNNHSLVYDLSATDVDGDSLSYEVGQCYSGATTADIKPIPTHPPYDIVTYMSAASYTSPMGSSVPFSVDAVTGWLTVTPNLVGQFLIGINCHEWRNGVMINTLRREFICLVVNCADGYLSSFHPSAGADTSILVGESIHFHGLDCISGNWTPATYLSNPSILDPVGTFPEPGTYAYVLHAVSDSGCSGTDTININVLPYADFAVPNAFSPNNDGYNDYFEPIPQRGAALKDMKIYNRAGNLVYEGGPGDLGWDGKHHGKNQELGVYFWMLIYLDNNGIIRKQHGSLTLVR